MNKTVLVVAALLATGSIVSACKSKEDAVKDSENEVFAIHDEVMPKISDMIRLQKQLNQRITFLDSLKGVTTGATAVRATEEKEQVARLSRSLVVADSLMTGWMSSYDGDSLAKLPPEDALRYLSAQKEQITDVKTKVNTSIEQARQFLEGN